MKPLANKLLQEAKMRAFFQINYALNRLAKQGNFGTTFNWWDSDSVMHTTTAHYNRFYNFRLGEWEGEENSPLYYDSSIHRWDTVLNMPIDNLIDCADGFLFDIYCQFK